MKIFLTTIAIVSVGFAFAQRTEIEYNYQTEEFRYFKIIKKKDTIIRKEIKRPYSYKGTPTKIVVKDLNTFYYDVKMTAESHDITPVNGDQSVELLAENFTKGFGAFNGLIGEVKENDIYKSLFVDGKFQGIEGIKNGLGMAESQFQSKMELLEMRGMKLEETQLQLSKSSKNLKKSFDQLLLADFVNVQMLKLQQNRNISPSEMIERSDLLIRKLLKEDISLEGVIDGSEDVNLKLATDYSAYKSGFLQYEVQHNDLISEIGKLKSQLGEDSFLPIVAAWEAELEYDFLEIKNNLDALDMLMVEQNTSKVRNTYLNAFESYDEIIHSDFEFKYSVEPEKDVTMLKMEFIEDNNSSDSTKSSNVIKTRNIEIPTKGGLRINSSAGVSFLRFFNGHSSYSNDNGIVREIQGDAFRPALTTMFHFYNQTYRPVTVGGSFGVSVPVEGEKAFIYMLGTSFIFGKGQRVILNAGAFGGKIERLSGVNKGDAIPVGAVVPTKAVFDFGAYIGITLNINKLF